jgi:hypothetical protein
VTLAGPFGSAEELLRRLAACRTGDDVGIVEDWTDELLEAIAQRLERLAGDDGWTAELPCKPRERELIAGSARIIFSRAAGIVREQKPPAVRRAWRRERPPR